MHIEVAGEKTVQENLRQLKDLLINSVDHGASIGWIPPMKSAEAEAYWRSRIAEIATGGCALLIAWEGKTLVGSAQLGLEQRDNGNHRAEVQKVMVHTYYRRQGIGKALMLALEDCAIQHKRSLLILDTSQGDPAEALYQKLGYTQAGIIPNYARYANGELRGTVFYYKILSS